MSTPQTPTVNQIASVIAQHEADWREVIEDAGECRFMSSADAADADAAASLAATTCLLKESTMALTAGTVVDELAGNGAPDEILDLTNDTIRTLALISQAAVNEHCDPFEPFEKSQVCSTALGAAFTGYNDLEKLLNGWGVYIG